MTDALRFAPARIVVHAGDTVEWKNTSSFVDTVTADARRAAPDGRTTFVPSRVGMERILTGFGDPLYSGLVITEGDTRGRIRNWRVRPTRGMRING